MISASDRALVRRRAENRCEYCGLHQGQEPGIRFQVEHIIPRQHGGGDEIDNLALACLHCNVHKGPNLAGIDPETGQMQRLFHPRQDRWRDHFAVDGPFLAGLTSIGRVTIRVLAVNDENRVILRSEL